MTSTVPQTPLWVINKVVNHGGGALSFSDGKPVEGVTRGGSGVSCRLIDHKQGFLDITTFELVFQSLPGAKELSNLVFDFNDKRSMWPDRGYKAFDVSLTISKNGTFEVSLCPAKVNSSSPPNPVTLSGAFKKFPKVSNDDVAYIDDMIARKYVPYQNIPAPGKTDQEIRKLGLRLFPWSPHSYQLAMVVYDWTTADFARMVFLKVFEYTSIDQTPPPLDLRSLAQMIWQSNWGTYVPGDLDYMNSFMMKPAETQLEVENQLMEVQSELHKFSDVENRLLAAAAQSLPRTCILAKPYLFSGQVDIQQMGMSRFGIEMLEFPGNKGPVGNTLEVAFVAAERSFLKPDSIITTKMVWAFTDTEEDALHYANGILLVVEPPADSFVWDTVAYVTELSDNDKKIEYIFPPGSSFRVRSIDHSESVLVIRLQTLSNTSGRLAEDIVSIPEEGAAKKAALRGAIAAAEDAHRAGNVDEFNSSLNQSIRLVTPALDQIPRGESPEMNHVEANCTGGRWCRCVAVEEGRN
ncbi:hypothetical protein AAF712_007451 [Marasmius tenuissimus]|uniref:Uncharacterized protein n=1 Tax=Marasmius tenuissimus TaxID=585030 RepID=A0ABR2ZW51_9AGAR|nr:hypothetical protein PM082_001884 [Marasmius tenuissimus]